MSIFHPADEIGWQVQCDGCEFTDRCIDSGKYGEQITIGLKEILKRKAAVRKQTFLLLSNNSTSSNMVTSIFFFLKHL